MNDTIPAWEKQLLGMPLTAEEQERLDSQAAAAAEHRRQEQAEEERRRQAWPMLHDDRDTVDLGDVWHRLWDSGHDERGPELVDMLAEQAGGVAKRLAAGVRSLSARRDENVHVAVANRDGDLIEVVAWSMGGCWNTRAWWVRCTLEVRTDQYGEVILSPLWGATLLVCGAGGTTVFEDPEYGPVGLAVARWHLAWEGRRAVRERLGIAQPELAEQAISREQFLALCSQG